MGLLVDGVWHDKWTATAPADGRFERSAAQFRNWVTADGASGPTGRGGFKAESGRYHLYVSHACPWAHRTVIFRALKKLEPHVSLSVVHWHMAENGWTFAPGDGVIPDPIVGAQFMHQVYTAANPAYSGRVSVPVLWDRQTKTIVNNESPEIIRMFNSAFDSLPGVDTSLDFYPADLRSEIDAVNARVYATVNNGVYRAGFVTSQAAYEEAARELFASITWQCVEQLGAEGQWQPHVRWRWERPSCTDLCCCPSRGTRCRRCAIINGRRPATTACSMCFGSTSSGRRSTGACACSGRHVGNDCM